jgi:hypothetical protein
MSKLISLRLIKTSFRSAEDHSENFIVSVTAVFSHEERIKSVPSNIKAKFDVDIPKVKASNVDLPSKEPPISSIAYSVRTTARAVTWPKRANGFSSGRTGDGPTGSTCQRQTSSPPTIFRRRGMTTAITGRCTRTERLISEHHSLIPGPLADHLYLRVPSFILPHKLSFDQFHFNF